MSKEKIINNLKIVSILLLILPIFISIKSDLSIEFSRNSNMQDKIYIGSIPIGFFIFILFNFNIFLRSILKIKIIFIYILLLIIFDYMYNNFINRLIIERINIFLCLMVLITTQNLMKENILNIDRQIMYSKSLLILSSIFILIWLININPKTNIGGVLPFGLHTYNFEQYGAFLMYAIFISTGMYFYKQKILFWVLSLLVAILLLKYSYSRIILVIWIYSLLFEIINNKLIINKFIKNNIIILFILINIVYFITLLFTNGFFNIDSVRVELLLITLSQLSIINILAPLFVENNYLYSSHNQFLEILRSIGIIGLLLFLFELKKIAKSITNIIPNIFLFIIISLTVLPFSHPYAYCVLSLLICMYSINDFEKK